VDENFKLTDKGIRNRVLKGLLTSQKEYVVSDIGFDTLKSYYRGVGWGVSGRNASVIKHAIAQALI
jgi:hypothetical protein